MPFYQNNKVLIGYLLLLIVGFIGMRTGFGGFFDQFDLSFTQIVFFPLLVVFVWLVSKRWQVIPTSLLIIAALVGTSVSVLGLSVRTNGLHSVHLAKFLNDQHGAQSRIFREALDAKLVKFGTAHAFRYRQEIADRQTAQQVLGAEQGIHLLLWGDSKGLRWSFSGLRSIELNTFPEQLGAFRDLRPHLISQIPIIGMSHEPRKETQTWLALVATAVIESRFTEDFDNPKKTHMIEQMLLEAASMQVAWRTAEPRSFAWWLLGNFYLQQGLQALQSSHDRQNASAHFACAANAYKTASRFIRAKSNPELYAAIHNNYAVLELLKRNFKLAKVKLKSVKRSLNYGLRARTFPGDYQAQADLFKLIQLNQRILNAQDKLMLAKVITPRVNKKKKRKRKLRRAEAN